MEPTTAEWRESDALSLAEATTDDLNEASETDSTNAFAADSEQRMVAGQEQVEPLVEQLRRLAIAEFVPCSSAAVLPTVSPVSPMWLLETQLPTGEIPSSCNSFQTATGSQATVVPGASVDTPTLASIFPSLCQYVRQWIYLGLRSGYSRDLARCLILSQLRRLLSTTNFTAWRSVGIGGGAQIDPESLAYMAPGNTLPDF